ncbi:energy-coupling factor ABC transporter substrate-binding protein [Rugamonas rivuli]|uniref:Cobalt transport protein CbiN n=1 Tax=Rugamonas rivuli TaxID=2743358 RepID=A0A843SKB3_9BURK|nr:energy-coupling factor ABC transporter substrate-binding protein [Rugamonas rivuli]MQA22623.1 energy-coupling factor ABC transporter substrate-binding protein [Rugamonas rivuli]
MKARTCLLWLAIVLLTVLPLWLVSAPPAAPGAEAPAIFAGADDRAQRAIGDIAPGYQPWFAPVFSPASPEIASLLFALQAAIGAGVIGFWLGLSVARERARREAAAVSSQDRRAD